jgi:hypothetical protein
MTNRVIFGLIVFILSGSVYAGGVTIRNYSGEHVMVMIGTYQDNGYCLSDTTIYDPSNGDAILNKAGSYWSKDTWQCGTREPRKRTTSKAFSIYLKPGQSYTASESGERAGGNMMVFATSVKPGSHNGSGLTWHDGSGIYRRTAETYWKKIGLCTAYHFPGWDSKTKAFKPVSRVGAQAFNPESCGPMLKHYFYNDTESKQYELVLTRENARREYHRAWNPYYRY